MTTADVILLLAIIFAAGFPAWLLVFRKRSDVGPAVEQAHLAELQRALTDELARLRENLDRAQRELNDSLKLTFETRIDALKTSVAETLAKGRESQDARLDKVETSLRDLITQFKTAQAELQQKLYETLKTQGEANTNAIVTLQERVAKEVTGLREGQTAELTKLREVQAKELGELREKQAEASLKLGEDVRGNLEKVSKANEEKLELIRKTVDEKLHETLEARLGKSFEQVSKQLEQVYKGLGEMQTLASDVGGLKRVLTNVRSRGSFGEVQLEALLEQVFTPSQFEKNCITIPGSSERVEFALLLPGRNGDNSPVRLPIDAKFPIEARERLEQALEDGDKEAYLVAQKDLGRILLGEASKIHGKYVSPPHTTDFAMMFIPTEGLYAEVLRIPGLAEAMHSTHHVIPVGPMNLFAILNSLQMGFKTLAIEQRSAEVWKILGAVKTEFGKFGDVLQKVGEKLDSARKTIDSTGVRTRAIERHLRGVEALPETDTRALLDETLPTLGLAESGAEPEE